MSTPLAPESPKTPEHPYQTTDTPDHPHTCPCDHPKTETYHCHAKTCHNHQPPPSHLQQSSNHIQEAYHSPQLGSRDGKVVCTCHHEENEGKNEDTGRNKLEAEDRIEISPLPPALPPRPPPRPRTDPLFGTLTSRYVVHSANPSGGGIRKYVFWCCVCGGLATILGALFLAVYFLLRSYTSTLGYFETIPTFVPATMLILTGLCVMSLARRKNRYSYLIKVCGLCCLVCALTCVLVTITTTVIHMNRLQTLRECVYTQKTRTCTCYSVLLEAHGNIAADDGMRFVFDSTPDCEVIHGALYSCLRAMFGLSVSGILVCIFSCMLVYQLLSHEKKKMYWEQLELRCRSFYQQHSGGTSSTHGSVRGPPMTPVTYCSCCEECRYPSIPAGPQVFPWETHAGERFWTPGRVGNFYSPNPGEEIVPVSDTRERTGWNWRRLPWNRNNGQSESQRDHSLTYQGGISSTDSQYGFGNRPGGGDSSAPCDPMSGSTGSYSVLDNRPPIGGIYVWGPPPPYSNPNSPARRLHQSPARYHHLHHHNHSHESHCQMNEERTRRVRPHVNNKDNYENTTETEVHQINDNSESTDTSSCVDRVSHTLPARKIKKRTDIASVKSTNQSTKNRTNVQNVFTQNHENKVDEHDYNEPVNPESSKPTNDQQCRYLPRLQGVENAAFQKQENSPQKPEATESEVYFADVSSCCNISVKNDGHESSLYDEALETHKPRLTSLQKPETTDIVNNQLLQNFNENISTPTGTDEDDYLSQRRMSARQMSVMNRMAFPLPSSENLQDYQTDACANLISKDISQNSLCSSVQTPMTESTDDAISPVDCCYFPEINSKDQTPKHRQFSDDHFLAPDAQYEVIPEQDGFRQNTSNLANTISGLNTYGTQNFYNQNKTSFGYNSSGVKNSPPKSLNLSHQSPNKRNLGSNISTLIQNLGGNAVGLLYGDANCGEDEDIQVKACHSDETMDSGWQSGSEKLDAKKPENSDQTANKPVNV